MDTHILSDGRVHQSLYGPERNIHYMYLQPAHHHSMHSFACVAISRTTWEKDNMHTITCQMADLGCHWEAATRNKAAMAFVATHHQCACLKKSTQTHALAARVKPAQEHPYSPTYTHGGFLGWGPDTPTYKHT
eukprot:1157730-Pelagomonas_calceolata.AAC.5